MNLQPFEPLKKKLLSFMQSPVQHVILQVEDPLQSITSSIYAVDKCSNDESCEVDLDDESVIEDGVEEYSRILRLSLNFLLLHCLHGVYKNFFFYIPNKYVQYLYGSQRFQSDHPPLDS